jgi:hypothetical protein
MSFEAIGPFLFGNIKQPDLTLGIADCDFVVITERDGTDVVVELGGFVEPGYFGGAAGPEVEG